MRMKVFVTGKEPLLSTSSSNASEFPSCLVSNGEMSQVSNGLTHRGQSRPFQSGNGDTARVPRADDSGGGGVRRRRPQPGPAALRLPPPVPPGHAAARHVTGGAEASAHAPQLQQQQN